MFAHQAHGKQTSQLKLLDSVSSGALRGVARDVSKDERIIGVANMFVALDRVRRSSMLTIKP